MIRADMGNDGIYHFLDTEHLGPGMTSRADVTFLAPALLKGQIYLGQRYRIGTGEEFIVAEATVLNIFNSELLRREDPQK